MANFDIFGEQKERKAIGSNYDELKKSFSDNEFSQMHYGIYRYFFGKEIATENDGRTRLILTRNTTADIFGLAYTSTGIFAGFWNTNSEVFADKEKTLSVQGFCLSDSGEILLYCQDKSENEYFFTIGNLK